MLLQVLVPGSPEATRARNLLSPGLTPTGSSVTHFRRRCVAFVAIAAAALFHLGCGDGVLTAKLAGLEFHRVKYLTPRDQAAVAALASG